MFASLKKAIYYLVPAVLLTPIPSSYVVFYFYLSWFPS